MHQRQTLRSVTTPRRQRRPALLHGLANYEYTKDKDKPHYSIKDIEVSDNTGDESGHKDYENVDSDGKNIDCDDNGVLSDDGNIDYDYKNDEDNTCHDYSTCTSKRQQIPLQQED